MIKAKAQVLESDRCGFSFWLRHSPMLEFGAQTLVDTFILGPVYDCWGGAVGAVLCSVLSDCDPISPPGSNEV